jgi:hypothetical protein
MGHLGLRRGSASHVERQNGNIRQWCKRLACAFSNGCENLKAALALRFAYYNFCRACGSLRVTPATEGDYRSGLDTNGTYTRPDIRILFDPSKDQAIPRKWGQLTMPTIRCILLTAGIFTRAMFRPSYNPPVPNVHGFLFSPKR